MNRVWHDSGLEVLRFILLSTTEDHGICLSLELTL